jgi:hypothetical protein
MRTLKYTLDNLRKHTESIRVQSSHTLQAMQASIDQAFADFEGYLSEIESQPTSLERSTK